jgi:hypothetical protein
MHPALMLALMLHVVMLPVAPANARENRVLLDATIWVMPSEVYRVCLDVPTGTLGATARLMQEDGQAATEAVDVRIARYLSRADAPDITLIASTLEAARVAPVIGGLHCVMLNHRLSSQPGAPLPSRPQLVALRITVDPS